jgi:prepilin-type processing-associated H-X9-DG protein
MFSCTIGVAINNTNLKTSQIGDPSWFVVCGDGTQFGAVILGGATMLYERCAVACGGANWSDCSWTQECGLDPDYYDTWWTDPGARKRDTRHMGGSNVGFADGHAAWWDSEAFNHEHAYCGSPIMTGLTDVCCGTANPDGRLEGLCGKF